VASLGSVPETSRDSVIARGIENGELVSCRVRPAARQLFRKDQATAA